MIYISYPMHCIGYSNLSHQPVISPQEHKSQAGKYPGYRM